MKASIFFSTILYCMALSVSLQAMQHQEGPKKIKSCEQTCQTGQTGQTGQTCQSQTAQVEQDDSCHTQTSSQTVHQDCSTSEHVVVTCENYNADRDSSSSSDNEANCVKKTTIHLHRMSNLGGCSYKDQLLRTKHFHARKVTGMHIWSPKADCYKTISHSQAKAMSKALKNDQATCVVNQGQEQYIDMNQWADQLN